MRPGIGGIGLKMGGRGGGARFCHFCFAKMAKPPMRPNRVHPFLTLSSQFLGAYGSCEIAVFVEKKKIKKNLLTMLKE